MPTTIFLLTCLTLSVIAYQDLRARTVSWFLFLLLALSGGSHAFYELGSVRPMLLYISINLLFLLLQFGLLKTWLLLKNRRNTPVIDHSIGRGDIFFLLAVCCFFSPFNFILFYLLSLFFSLFVYLLIRRWPAVSGPGAFSSVPLAGLQAGFLLILLTVNNLLKYPLTNDNWLIPKLISQ